MATYKYSRYYRRYMYTLGVKIVGKKYFWGDKKNSPHWYTLAKRVLNVFKEKICLWCFLIDFTNVLNSIKFCFFCVHFIWYFWYLRTMKSKFKNPKPNRSCWRNGRNYLGKITQGKLLWKICSRGITGPSYTGWRRWSLKRMIRRSSLSGLQEANEWVPPLPWPDRGYTAPHDGRMSGVRGAEAWSRGRRRVGSSLAR